MKNRSKNPFKKVAVAILCGIVFGLFLVPNGCDKLRNIKIDEIIDRISSPVSVIEIGKGSLLYYNFYGIPIYPQKTVITDSTAWNTLINKMTRSDVTWVGNTFTETSIDFTQYQIIAVIDGNIWVSRSIDITDINMYASKIVVTYVVRKTNSIPNYDTMKQAFHIVKIPISNKPIVFQRENDYGENVPFIAPYERYTDLAGTGYLFMDSIPVALQYLKNQYNIMCMVYDNTQNKATFQAGNMPYYMPDKQLFYTGFSGTIDNFPDSAKKWSVPTTGIKVNYKGEFDYSGMNFGEIPLFGTGYLLLTTLKQDTL